MQTSPKMNTIRKTVCFTFLFIVSFFLNSEAQWTMQSSGISDGISDIFTSSSDSAYAVTATFASGGKIIATKNGSTWNQQYSSPDYLLTVFFRSSTLGWAGGGILPNGVVLKTTDGGVNWIPQATSVYQIYSIYFIDDTLGWAIGNDATQGRCYIYNSTNGGATWTQQFSGFDYLRHIYFTSPLVGYADGDNGRIFKTTDGGINWTLLTTGVVFHFNEVDFVTDSIGWAVGSYINGGCYYTGNGGNTWTAQTLPITQPLTLSSVSFVSPDSGWISGENGTVLFTSNGGFTWTIQSTPVSNDLSSISFSGKNNGYAAGAAGTIIRYENSSSALGETGDRSYTIGPNPTHDVLFINSIAASTEVEFRITDNTGRLVLAGLLKPEKTAISVENLSPGLYYFEPNIKGQLPLRFIKY